MPVNSGAALGSPLARTHRLVACTVFVYTCVGVGHFDFLCAHFLSHSRLPSRASPFPGVRPPRPAPHRKFLPPRPPPPATDRARDAPPRRAAAPAAPRAQALYTLYTWMGNTQHYRAARGSRNPSRNACCAVRVPGHFIYCTVMGSPLRPELRHGSGGLRRARSTRLPAPFLSRWVPKASDRACAVRSRPLTARRPSPPKRLRSGQSQSSSAPRPCPS